MAEKNKPRTDGQANRLIGERSPYLLQHARNPVDWYPWGDEAFDRARRESRPVFLSIGYSTCHWCHVMAHESFEDPEVARLMNETFVSVKVDREERPDLDHVYMTVCQMLTGSGGWPLTIVMTPDKRPFFAATYIPRTSGFGRTGMTELIPRIGEIWRQRRGEVFESADKIIAALRSMEGRGPGGDPDRTVLDKAYRELAGRFDREYGGFSSAPKFPTPHNLLFMLRYWKRSGDHKALEMVEKTLRAMRRGGIYDQVGFGFHRYATDREWLVPHFEKMLYDQALLALAYLETFQATGRREYGRTAEEIFTYVLRDMTAPSGAFYSAEDADSEGEEGKFYLWQKTELQRVLGPEGASIQQVFGVETGGNFREEATGVKSGANILHLRRPLPEVAAELGISLGALENRVAAARQGLFDARERRVHPHKDDKVLTDWNGLMIAALARGAQALGKREYAGAARKAADFLWHRLRKADGRLLHRFREGEAGIDAHLDDYAFLVWGLIELYEATFDPQYLSRALEMNAVMLDLFWDEKSGGLFFTPEDGEALIVRKKESQDGALPAGNSVAMGNLLRLARFSGKPELEERAGQIARAFAGILEEFPSGHTQLLVSLDFRLGPAYEVVVAGDSRAEETAAMIRALQSRFIPNKVLILRPTEEAAPGVDAIAPYVRDHAGIEGRPAVYVCSDFTCQAPTTDIGRALEMIE